MERRRAGKTRTNISDWVTRRSVNISVNHTLARGPVRRLKGEHEKWLICTLDVKWKITTPHSAIYRVTVSPALFKRSKQNYFVISVECPTTLRSEQFVEEANGYSWRKITAAGEVEEESQQNDRVKQTISSNNSPMRCNFAPLIARLWMINYPMSSRRTPFTTAVNELDESSPKAENWTSSVNHENFSNKSNLWWMFELEKFGVLGALFKLSNFPTQQFLNVLL